MAGFSANSSYEFDPLIVKGFRLLMSKREESAVELRQLFEEAVAQRSNKKVDMHTARKAFPGMSSAAFSNLPGKVDGKRAFDKMGSDANHDSKRLKLEDVSKPAANKVKLPQISPNSECEEFGMDYVLEKLVGLACEVCKKAEPTQMLECHSCSKTYHQACHQPNATGREAYDPRNVWYCSKCKPVAVPGSPIVGSARQGTSPVTAVSSPAKSSRSGQERDQSNKGSSSSHSLKKERKSSSADASRSNKAGSRWISSSPPSSSSAIPASSSSCSSSKHSSGSSADGKKHKEKKKDSRKKKH